MENENNNKYRKKTAMVTGIPGGIGKATAERFLDAGYAVCGMGRRALRSKAALPTTSPKR